MSNPIRISALLCDRPLRRGIIVVSFMFLMTVFASGQTTGNSAVVSGLDAISQGSGTLVRWEVKDGENVIGFNVYRGRGEQVIKANKTMIAGAYFVSYATPDFEFSFRDSDGNIGDTYVIEVIEVGRENRFTESTEAVFSTEKILESIDFSRGFDGEDNLLTKTSIPGAGESGLAPDPVKQYWVASQPGVKINVSKAGITRVSRTELQNAGFDVNTASANWQLYLDGREIAIRIGPADSYIEFYGKGVDLLETNKNVYFLVSGPAAGRRIGSKHLRAISAPVAPRNFESSFERKNRINYTTTILNGDIENYFGELVGSIPVNVDFDLKGHDPQSFSAEMSIDLQGLTQVLHSTKVVLNGVELAPHSGVNRTRTVKTYSLPGSALLATGNVLELTSLNGAGDVSLLASVKVNYKRLFSADNGQLLFTTRPYKKTAITGFTSSQIRVFDMSDEEAPALVSNAQIVPDGPNFKVELPSKRPHKLFAVSDSALLSADSIVANTPSTLADPSNAANFLIVTNAGWMAQANTWANYRATQGLQTKVVDVNDVFDEFGYGRTSAVSLRTFFQRASTMWQTPPAYILLLGDSTYDPRDYGGLGNNYFLPVKLVDTLYEETGSDETLTDFDDDGLAEIPIGRIPARVPADVTNALNKVIQFEANLATVASRGVLCASDVPQGYDFAGLCGRLHDELPAGIPKTHINRGDTDSKNVLIASINDGKYLVNYSGHGSVGVWASSTFFGLNHVPALSNQSNLSIFTMLTCLNGYFIRPVDDSLSEALLRTTGGGAVSVWSSTGSTTPDVQEVMARRFYSKLGNSNLERIGDFIKDAKNSVVGGRDVRLSWVLHGDPALRVKPPVMLEKK